MGKIALFMNYLDRNQKHVLMILFVMAFILRAVYVWYKYSTQGMLGWNDALYYIHLGEQYAAGSWDPAGFGGRLGMFVAPVVPLLVGLFVFLFQDAMVPFFVYNILITSLMVPVCYHLGKELFNRETAWMMALWALFFFWSYKYSAIVLKEATLFLFLPLTLLFLLKSLKENKRIKHIVFAALSFAWLIHTDERYIMYFPLFTMAFFFIKPFRVKAIILSMVIWTGSILLLMLPWTIHNYHKYDQLVVLTARTTSITSKLWGQDVYNSHHKRHDSERSLPFEGERKERIMKFAEEYDLEPRLYGKTEARLRGFVHLWRPLMINPRFIANGLRPEKWHMNENIMNMLSYGLFLPFYLIGIFLLWKQKHFLGLLVAMIPLFHNLIHAFLIAPLVRYRLPIYFIVALVGCYTMVVMFNRVFMRHSKKSVE